jgi:hypothetical protein
MPIKIEGNKTNSIHGSFWNALTKNSDSLALSQLWLCAIKYDKLELIATAIDGLLGDYEQGAWGVGADVSKVLLRPENWDGVSPGAASDIYLWTRGISFIGDGQNASRIGSMQNGAIKGLILDGRTELTTANITFLESNISFVDGLLRPWSVLAGYRSIKDQNLRCDIELFALEKWELDKPFKVRKSMVFKNAVPVSIDAEEYNYTGDKLIERQVQFAFDRYELRIYPDITDKGIVDFQNSTFWTTGKKAERSDKSVITNKPVINDEMGNAVGTIKTDLGDPGITSPKPKDITQGKKAERSDNSVSVDNPLIYDEEGNLVGLLRPDPGPEVVVLEPADFSIMGALHKISDTLGKVQGAVNVAKGKVSDVSSSVAQGLKAFGMEGAANKVSQANQTFATNYANPFGKIVATGQGYTSGAQNVGLTVGNVTGASKVSANAVAGSLASSTPAAPSAHTPVAAKP